MNVTPLDTSAEAPSVAAHTHTLVEHGALLLEREVQRDVLQARDAVVEVAAVDDGACTCCRGAHCVQTSKPLDSCDTMDVHAAVNS